MEASQDLGAEFNLGVSAIALHRAIFVANYLCELSDAAATAPFIEQVR
jgi:hypothetical protein